MGSAYVWIFAIAMGYLLLELAKSFAPTRYFKNPQEPVSTENRNKAEHA